MAEGMEVKKDGKIVVEYVNYMCLIFNVMNEP